MELDRLAARPARHLALRHLGHEPSQPLHALAVEGGQHQLRWLRCAPSSSRITEFRPTTGSSTRAPSRMEHLGRRGEHLPRLIGVGEMHEQRRLEEAQCEAVAVARAAALEERDPVLSTRRGVWTAVGHRGPGGSPFLMPPSLRGPPVPAGEDLAEPLTALRNAR